MTTRPVIEDFQTTRRKARRRVWLQVILPLALLGVLIFIGLPIFFAIFFTPTQLGTVAAFMAALFIFFPTVLLCFLPYVVLIFAVLGMVKVNRRVPRTMHSLRSMVVRTNHVVERASHTVAAPVIGASKRLAWLERALGIEPPHAK
jgi:hypothetical protein